MAYVITIRTAGTAEFDVVAASEGRQAWSRRAHVTKEAVRTIADVERRRREIALEQPGAEVEHESWSINDLARSIGLPWSATARALRGIADDDVYQLFNRSK